jgi:hypothetical protein
MRFGVREICNVVLRAKGRQQVGNKIFYKHEPVIYFDTLKTSSLEGAATTVYAQGGRGNSRLVAWEGERTVTFTMEDALISPEGFMILSGAGLIDSSKDKPIMQHVTETIDGADVSRAEDGTYSFTVSKDAYLPTDKGDNFAYVMFMKDGEIITEPYIPVHGENLTEKDWDTEGKWPTSKTMVIKSHGCYDDSHAGDAEATDYLADRQLDELDGAFDSVLVDYYTPRPAYAKQIEITPDKFGGNFYLEAETLFRDTNGFDMPAEFIIPNCKIQSNFTFTMASSGDPSSFTFTMDAFPDYTRFDHSKKVLAAIQIIEEEASQDNHRGETPIGDYSIRGGDNEDHHDTFEEH